MLLTLTATAARGVVIAPFEAQSPDVKTLATALTKQVLTDLGSRYEGLVIGQDEITARLDLEARREALACDSDEACLTKMTEVIGNSLSLNGTVGKLGDNYSVILKLIDPKKAATVADEIVTGGSNDEMMKLVPATAARLLGVKGSKPAFEIASIKGSKAAVFDLQAYDVEAGKVGVLTQILSLELRRAGMTVTSKDDIEKILALRGMQDALNCNDDTQCLVEIGGALGVDYLVTGDVGRLGKQYVINLSLIDTTTNEAANRASETFQGDAKHLRDSVRFAAWKLLGAPTDGKGAIRLSANVSDGRVSIDGSEPVKYPDADAFEDLIAGKHTLTLKSDGFYDLYQEFYVDRDALTELQLELQEVPAAVWQRWWFWTIIGVGVAAGAAASVAVLSDSPDTGNVNVSLMTR